MTMHVPDQQAAHQQAAHQQAADQQAHGHEAGPGTDVATRGGAALPERFENPGLPVHRHRMADVDPAAAKRAERQVAALFVVSVLGTLLIIVAYFSIKFEGNLSYTEYFGRVQLSNLLLGVGMFLSLMGIGTGAVHWAKTLMPDEERIELRHPMRSSDADRADAVAILEEGSAESGLGRRPLIRNTLIGAMALFPVPALVFLRDTGPMPHGVLSTTFWNKDVYLVKDPEGGRVLASDVTQGSVVHIMPEGVEKTEHPLDERAKAAVLLIGIDPSLIPAEAKDGSYAGILAYSKICTHLGCPVALYEQQTHHLLCPCHQSTFDITKNCEVIFGPARRPLPQLAITVDADGYLKAKAPFSQAVGPSFWERG
jgi:ubiquinol-cytochrome c reductase iron-sulfur subunit